MNNNNGSSGTDQQRRRSPFGAVAGVGELTTLQQANTINAISGGVAGAFSKTCTAPLARLTILFQLQGMHAVQYSLINQSTSSIYHYHPLARKLLQAAIKPAHLLQQPSRPSIAREAYRIVTQEGCLALWKGNLATILHRTPYAAINFYAYQKYRETLQHIHTSMNGGSGGTYAQMGIHFMAGAGSGLTAASVAYPLDLVRTRLSAQTTEKYYRGVFHALHIICRDEGLKGLYRGIGAALLDIGPSIAINFCVYNTMKSAWEDYKKREGAVAAVLDEGLPWSSLAFGSMAGLVSTTVTYPLDIVRRRRQMEGVAGRSHSNSSSSTSTGGVVSALGSIYKREGWRGLYRGMVPEYLEIIPSTAIMFMTFEFVKTQLHRGIILA